MAAIPIERTRAARAAAQRLARQLRISPGSVASASAWRFLRRPLVGRLVARRLQGGLELAPRVPWAQWLLEAAGSVSGERLQAILASDATLFGCAFTGDVVRLAAADPRFAIERSRLQALHPLLAAAWHEGGHGGGHVGGHASGRRGERTADRIGERLGRRISREIGMVLDDGPPAYPMDMALQALSLVLALVAERHGRIALAAPVRAKAEAAIAGAIARCFADPEYSASLSNNHHLTTAGCLHALLAAVEGRTATARSHLAAMRNQVRRWLLRAVSAQFAADGSHFEGSSAYHLCCLEVLALASLVECAGGVGPTLATQAEPSSATQAELSSATQAELSSATQAPSAARLQPSLATLRALCAPLAEALSGAAGYAAALCRPDGSWPRIGDDDASRILRLNVREPRPWPASERYRIDDSPDSAFGRRVLECAQAASIVEWVRALFGPETCEARDTHGERAAAARAFEIATTLTGSDRAALGALLGARAAELDSFVRYSCALSGDAPLVVERYEGAGLLVAHAPGVHLTMRSGRVGQRGVGTHSHVDALSVDLWCENGPRIEDPGSRAYAARREVRDRYRSVSAHFTPLWRCPQQRWLAHPFALLGRPWCASLTCRDGILLGMVELRDALVVRMVRAQARELVIVDAAHGMALEAYPFADRPDPTPGYFGPLVKYASASAEARRQHATHPVRAAPAGGRAASTP